MKNNEIKIRVEKLLVKAQILKNNSDKLSAIAQKHLENGNELEWEDALKGSVAQKSYADGIEFALKTLGLM